MTDPRYEGLVIIMAGYQAEMSKMLDTNPGLKSRFQHFLEFPDWSPQDCVDLFLKKAEGKHFELDVAGPITALSPRCLSLSPSASLCPIAV